LITPTGIAIDSFGDVYVTEASAGNIIQFTSFPSGESIFVSGLSGPQDVSIDSFDDVYVAEASAGVVTKFTEAAAADSDADGIPDEFDNCPFDFNPGQEDSDFNGIGNICDGGFGFGDLDGDGFTDDIDNCPVDFNPDQADSNSNGIGDACEFDFIDAFTTMIMTASPVHVVMQPTDTVETFVTIQKIAPVNDPILIFPESHIPFFFAPNTTFGGICDFIAVDADTGDPLPSHPIADFQFFNFGTDSIKVIKAKWTCTDAPLGSYVSWFDTGSFDGFDFAILDLFVDIASGLAVILDPPGGSSGDSIQITGYQFPANQTVSMTIEGPSTTVGGDSLTILSCSIEDSGAVSGHRVNSDGTISCIVSIPSGLISGAYQITVSAGGLSEEDEFEVFSAGGGTFKLQVTPSDLLLDPPEVPVFGGALGVVSAGDIGEELSVTYTKIGSFTDTVDVSILGIPFGVSVLCFCITQ